MKSGKPARGSSWKLAALGLGWPVAIYCAFGWSYRWSFAIHLDHPEWGTVGDWANAVGTVGAVAIALSIAIAGSRRDRETQQKQHAIAVDCWTEYSSDPANPVKVWVRNSGTRVFYDWRVDGWIPEEDQRKNLLTNSSRTDGPMVPSLTGTSFLVSKVMLGAADATAIKADLYFKDTNGTWWHRPAMGELHPVTGEVEL